MPFFPVRTVAALNVTGPGILAAGGDARRAGQGHNREVVDAVAVASDGGLSCKVERQVIAVTDK